MTRKSQKLVGQVLLSLSLACLGTALFDGAPAVAAQKFSQRFERVVRPYLRGQRSHAYSLAIYKDGREFVKGYGQLSETDPQKPDGDTLYEIASITKVMTGLLLADAVNRGRVRFDQPAGELLPDGVSMPRYGNEQIQLLDLSTHVSGLPRLPTNMATKNRPDPYRHYSQAKLFEFLNSHELRRAPRTEWEYSNLGVGLLADLLANDRDSDFPTLLRETVTAPLGLSDTAVNLTADQEKRRAPPHRADLEPSIPRIFPVLSGCGAVVSSANDLLRFGRAVLDPPPGPIGSAIDLGWQVHQQPIEGGRHAMCLGWHVSSVDESTRIHSGKNAGYRASLYVSRKHNAVVAVLSNANESGTPELATKLFQTAIGRNVKPDKIERPIEVPANVMDRCVGRYQTPKGGIYTVERNGEKLMVQFNKQASYRVFPKSRIEWEYRNYETVLKFNPGPSDRYQSVDFVREERTFTAVRID